MYVYQAFPRLVYRAGEVGDDGQAVTLVVRDSHGLADAIGAGWSLSPDGTPIAYGQLAAPTLSGRPIVEFPRMIYHGSLPPQIVADRETLSCALESGWRMAVEVPPSPSTESPVAAVVSKKRRGRPRKDTRGQGI